MTRPAPGVKPARASRSTMRHRLTLDFVRTVAHSGKGAHAERHHDGGGLYLQVMPTGSKQWLWRGALNGTQRLYGLGPVAELTLDEARDTAMACAVEARRYRRAKARGEDPAPPVFEAQRRATMGARGRPVDDAGMRAAEAVLVAQTTFREAFERCIAERAPQWKNPETDLRSWRADLKHHLAAIASKPVAAVTVPDLDGCLAALTPAGKDKVLRRVGTVFAWAEARELRPDNPARKLRASWSGLKRPAAAHRKALPWREAPAFFSKLLAGGTGADARGALALAVLTGVRGAEVRKGARWEHVDLESRTWRIPAEVMKDGRAHRVPLSEAACAVLRAAGPKGAGLVFRARQGGVVSDKALRAVLAAMGVDATVHGFRSSLRDWCAERGVPREVAEACLAHKVGSSVEQAYARTDLFDRRRAEVMDPWAAWLTGAGQ